MKKRIESNLRAIELGEIDEYWDINDLADANEALDIKSDIEEYLRKEIGKNDPKNTIS